MSEPRVIKKYPNRRLYDTVESRYITLADVRRLVVEKIDFVVVDKKNNYIWMSGQQADMIVRFDPKTTEWVEFPLADAESDARRIDIDPTNPNRIYWAGNIPGRMGFIEVLPQ